MEDNRDRNPLQIYNSIRFKLPVVRQNHLPFGYFESDNKKLTLWQQFKAWFTQLRDELRENRGEK